MAKKKEVTLRLDGGTRDAVPSGEVNIYYGQHTLIGGLSETVIAKLETEDTIVHKNIFVEYNRPTIPTNLYYTKSIPLTVTIPFESGGIVVGYASIDANNTLTLDPKGFSGGTVPVETALNFVYVSGNETVDITIGSFLARDLTLTLTADNIAIQLVEVIPGTTYGASVPITTSQLTITAS